MSRFYYNLYYNIVMRKIMLLVIMSEIPGIKIKCVTKRLQRHAITSCSQRVSLKKTKNNKIAWDVKNQFNVIEPQSFYFQYNGTNICLKQTECKIRLFVSQNDFQSHKQVFNQRDDLRKHQFPVHVLGMIALIYANILSQVHVNLFNMCTRAE